MSKRPNVLLVMADELRYDVTGFSGNNVVRTRTLDKIAKTATVYTNAYTPSPICIPARQCIAAGQYTTTCKAVGWGDDLPAGYLTFPRLLSQHGYETVACGKLHHMGPDQMQGYKRRYGMETRVDDSYIPNIDEVKTISSVKWSQDVEVANATSGVKTFHIREDEIATECAEYFIEQYFCDPFYRRNTPNKPLLLTVSYNQPHYPYVAEAQLLDYYIDKVAVYHDEPIFPHPFLSMHVVNAEEKVLRKATAAYYSMIETMDSYVKRIVEALEKTGQDLDDWMIIFTTDHGEMLGQHGVWEKQKFFEASAKVPLFIKYPHQKELKTCDKNVNLCDLYKTICKVADVETPDNLDSRNLYDIAFGENACDKNETMSTFGGNNIMLKVDDLKYQFYRNDNSEVLFDLKRDKTENTNFIELPEYQKFIAECRTRIKDFGFEKV